MLVIDYLFIFQSFLDRIFFDIFLQFNQCLITNNTEKRHALYFLMYLFKISNFQNNVNTYIVFKMYVTYYFLLLTS